MSNATHERRLDAVSAFYALQSRFHEAHTNLLLNMTDDEFAEWRRGMRIAMDALKAYADRAAPGVIDEARKRHAERVAEGEAD